MTYIPHQPPPSPHPSSEPAGGISLDAANYIRKLLDMPELRRANTQERNTPLEIAENAVKDVLREELSAALREWILGPEEFEPGARERIKSAIERSRTALRYVCDLLGSAG